MQAKMKLDNAKKSSDFWQDWTLTDKWSTHVRKEYSRADVIKHLENLEGTPMFKAVQSVLK